MTKARYDLRSAVEILAAEAITNERLGQRLESLEKQFDTLPDFVDMRAAMRHLEHRLNNKRFTVRQRVREHELAKIEERLETK